MKSIRKVQAEPNSRPVWNNFHGWRNVTMGFRCFRNSFPSAHINSVFFYICLNIVLRGEEHRQLKISQLVYEDDVVDPSNPGTTTTCVKYVEHGSKNRPGGWHQLNLDNKVVIQYAQPLLGNCCHVYYLSKLPKCAVEEDFFYWKPRKEIPPDGEPWYTRNVVHVGHNVLDKMLKKVCWLWS